MKLATLSIHTASFTDKRRAQLRTLKKFLPDWVHIAEKVPESASIGVEISKRRPLAVMKLLDEGYDGVLFLGTDVMFYSEPVLLRALASCKCIGLTPHLKQLPPLDSHHPSATDFLKAGRYNADFAYWPNTPQAREFLAWQSAAMAWACGAHTFFDQGWLGMIDPRLVTELPATYNAAYYNMHERELTNKGGDYLIDGYPLVAYHFTGYIGPTSLSRHQNRLAMTPAQKLLYSEYEAEIKRTNDE